MTRTNKILLAVLVVAVLIVGVGYAALQNITLNVAGGTKADPSQANFLVKFTNETSIDKTGISQPDIATITAAVVDDTNATIDIAGLTAKGDIAKATYTVQNVSDDLSADLTASASIYNEEYFAIDTKLGKTSLTAGEATTLEVIVKLIKTPITQSEEATLGIQLTAAPVQPGLEGTSGIGGTGGGGSTGGGGNTTGNVTTEGIYLPSGFSELIGTSLATGLTIQDSTGNQYVWVEVPQTTEVYPTAGLAITAFTDDEYTAIENDLHTYTSVYRKGTDYTDTYYSDDATGLTETQYNELKQKMLKSVYQNGGFYVGKYETGIEAAPKTSGSADTAPTETAVIKKNAYPYNYVTCSQAQSLASNMPSGEYTSSLMFGVQWDLVLKYLETKGATQSELNSDSANWGNYKNNNWTISNANSKYSTNNGSTWTTGLYNGTGSKGNTSTGILLSTGASDTFSKQGIYDLAGNVSEWTLEKTSNTKSPCTARGGYYNNAGNYYPARMRGYNNTTGYDYGRGFRVALY